MNIILLPCRFGMGDHRLIIINFRLDDIVEYRVNIYALNMRRLIGNKSLVVARCNAKAIELVVSYKINRNLDILENE